MITLDATNGTINLGSSGKISGNAEFDGTVTKTAHPAFRAGCNSDISLSGNQTVAWQDVTSTGHFNIGGHYNTSNGAFTAPVEGIYNFYVAMIWKNMNDGEDMHDAFYLYYNTSGGASGGSLVNYDIRRAEYVAGTTGSGGYYSAFSTCMLNMAANSSVYVRNRVALTLTGNTNFCYWQGYLIG